MANDSPSPAWSTNVTTLRRPPQELALSPSVDGTGIGAAGTAILGIMLFHESASALRLVCIALILTGVVGLKVLAK